MPQKGNTPGYYKLYGGGASLYHLSLEYLYQEHLKHRNIWTATNEGFDLARYFGTKFYLYPHPELDYLFWWETDFGALRKSDYGLMHPSQAMLQRNHVIVKSMYHFGLKRKVVKIPPPSVHQSQWYFMYQWCNVALVRFGFTLINLSYPFLHKDQTKPWVAGGYLPGFKDRNKPGTDDSIFNASNATWYKWRWDTGQDNIVIQQKKVGTTWKETARFTTNEPYWLFFYGWGWFNFDTASTTRYLYWWYPDRITDGDKFEVEELPNKNKEWIIMCTDKLNVAQIGLDIAQRGPFVVSNGDMNNPKYNLYFQYLSKWQWGGTSPTPESTVDPCTQPPAAITGSTVRIGDPATTGKAMLHPWDLNKHGFITKQKLRQLLGGTIETYPAGDKEQASKSPPVDSEPSTEESGAEEEISSEDWDSQESQTEDTYHLLTKRISRERKWRKQLRRRIKRLVNN